ncbi:modification methylase [Campylobacter helveticus]|uniref:modification methylase n=1 Tax=Campylobacter helveticus TaxID=28898 RepID=UPI00214C75B7|nr:modification methylase [Campylobacter helveticus]MCR2060835.1 modification methylase [Campylobacter helveticus]
MTLAIQESIKTIYNPKYDFLGQSYASMYPNLHKYPATMLPQIGYELLKEFKAEKSTLLDPYCGSGSSFMSGLEYGIKHFVGFDLNPLAILISKAKLNYIEKENLLREKDNLLENMIKIVEAKRANITNIDFWIEKQAQIDLALIFHHLNNIKEQNIKNLFLLAFSETLREVSYTRNNEFKLFRMKNYESYKPNVYKVFKEKLDYIIDNYLLFYQHKIKNVTHNITNSSFTNTTEKFDTILTSPPYGDSKTTVAYGQFSTFINEYMGFKNARKLDSQLLGGKKSKEIYSKGIMQEYIQEIAKLDKKRALEVSSFYVDLEKSILNLISALNVSAKIFFVVGNRQVKKIQLPTDKFIAEVFCNNGFKHLSTIKRKIPNKAMPLKNSPTNQARILSSTMNEEWIVVCEKKG